MDRQCVPGNNKVNAEAGRLLSCWMRSCDKAWMQLSFRKSPAASLPTPLTPPKVLGVSSVAGRHHDILSYSLWQP